MLQTHGFSLWINNKLPRTLWWVHEDPLEKFSLHFVCTFCIKSHLKMHEKTEKSRAVSNGRDTFQTVFRLFIRWFWQHFKFEWILAKIKALSFPCLFVIVCVVCTRANPEPMRVYVKLSFRVKYDSLFSGNVHFPFAFRPLFNATTALVHCCRRRCHRLYCFRHPFAVAPQWFPYIMSFKQSTLSPRALNFVFVRSKWMRFRMAERSQVKFRWLFRATAADVQPPPKKKGKILLTQHSVPFEVWEFLTELVPSGSSPPPPSSSLKSSQRANQKWDECEGEFKIFAEKAASAARTQHAISTNKWMAHTHKKTAENPIWKTNWKTSLNFVSKTQTQQLTPPRWSPFHHHQQQRLNEPCECWIRISSGFLPLRPLCGHKHGNNARISLQFFDVSTAQTAIYRNLRSTSLAKGISHMWNYVSDVLISISQCADSDNLYALTYAQFQWRKALWCRNKHIPMSHVLRCPRTPSVAAQRICPLHAQTACIYIYILKWISSINVAMFVSRMQRILVYVPNCIVSAAFVNAFKNSEAPFRSCIPRPNVMSATSRMRAIRTYIFSGRLARKKLNKYIGSGDRPAEAQYQSVRAGENTKNNTGHCSQCPLGERASNSVEQRAVIIRRCFEMVCSDMGWHRAHGRRRGRTFLYAKTAVGPIFFLLLLFVSFVWRFEV